MRSQAGHSKPMKVLRSRVIFALYQNMMRKYAVDFSSLKQHNCLLSVKAPWKLREHWPDMQQLNCAKFKELKSETVTKWGDLLLKKKRKLRRVWWDLLVQSRWLQMMLCCLLFTRIVQDLHTYDEQSLSSPDGEDGNSLLCCGRLLSTYVARETR